MSGVLRPRGRPDEGLTEERLMPEHHFRLEHQGEERDVGIEHALSWGALVQAITLWQRRPCRYTFLVSDPPHCREWREETGSRNRNPG
jgi:hypothetical protein